MRPLSKPLASIVATAAWSFAHAQFADDFDPTVSPIHLKMHANVEAMTYQPVTLAGLNLMRRAELQPWDYNWINPYSGPSSYD